MNCSNSFQLTLGQLQYLGKLQNEESRKYINLKKLHRYNLSLNPDLTGECCYLSINVRKVGRGEGGCRRRVRVILTNYRCFSIKNTDRKGASV